MNNSEKVSVIITTYKGSKCIRRAVDSVLKQTYKNLEVIVVDDNQANSKERYETEKIFNQIQDRRVKYIKHSINLNGSAARNTGISKSTGDFISFLDDDDYYLPEKIEKSLEVLRNNTDVEAVFCGVIITDNKHVLKVVQPNINNLTVQKDLLFNTNMFGTGSNLFFRKKCFEKLGYFDTTYYRLQDIEFMTRFFEYYKAFSISDLLVVKARSDSNNVPQYKKLLLIKNKFYKDFSITLSKLSHEELHDFYTNEYAILLQNCFGKESVNNLLQAKSNLQKYRGLKFKEYLFILLSCIGTHKYNVYRFVRSVLSKVGKPLKSQVLKKRYKINLRDKKMQLFN